MNDDMYVIYTHIFYAHLVCTTCVHPETLYMYTQPHLFLFGLYIHHYLLLQTTRLSASFIGRNSKKQAIVGSSKSKKKKKKNEKLSSITKPPRVHSQTNTKAPPSSDDTKESIRAMMPFVRLQESPLGFESIGGESHNTMAMSTASTHVISNVVISIQQQIDASAHEELKRKKKMEALAREKKEREEQRRIKEKQALEAERIKLEEELKRKKKKMEALAREKKEREQRRIKEKQALEAERIKLETQLKNEQAKQKLIDEIAVREKRLTAIRERKNQVIKEKDAAMEEARRISSHSTNKSSKEKCASQRRSRSKSRQTRRKPIKKANNEDDSTTFGGGDLWDNDTNRKSKVKTKKKLLLKDGMIVPMADEHKSKKKKNLFVERSSGRSETIGVDAADQQREEMETKRKKKKQAAVAGQSTKNIEHNTMQLNVPKEIEKKGRAFNLVPSLPRSKVSRGRTSSLGRKSNNKESKVVPKKKKFLRGTTRPKTLDKFEIESRVSTLAIESVLAAEEHVKKERQGQGSMIQLNMPEKKMEKKTNSTKLDELEEDVESKDVSTLLGFRDWQAKMAKKDNAKSKRSLSLSWRRNKDKFDTTDDSTTDVPNSVAYVVKKESCDVMSSSKDDNIAEKGGTNWFASWFTGWANAPASEESKEAINDKVANMGSGWANDGPSNDGVVSDGEEEDDETADEESKDDVGWWRNKDKFDTTDDSTTDVPNSVAYVVKKESCDVMSSSKDDNIAEKGGTNWFASWFTGWANAPASEESKEAINDKVANMGSGWANDGPSNDGVVSDGEEEDDETADEESKDDVGWFTYDTGTVDDVTSHKDDKRKYTDDRDDNYADGETTVGSYTDDGTNLTADSSIREGWFSKWANDGGGEEDVTIDEYQGSLYCEVEETVDERYYSSLEDSSDDEYEESSDDESDESSDDESSDEMSPRGFRGDYVVCLFFG